MCNVNTKNNVILIIWIYHRGKKSLEKKLEKTKDDLAALSEKLQQAMNGYFFLFCLIGQTIISILSWFFSNINSINRNWDKRR